MKDWTEMLALLLFSVGPGARPVPSLGLNFPVSKMGARVGRDQCHPACGLQDALVHELLLLVYNKISSKIKSVWKLL